MIKLSEYLNQHQLARFRRALADELGELDDGSAAEFICRPDDGGTGGAHLSTIERRARDRACGREFDRVRERFEL